MQYRPSLTRVSASARPVPWHDDFGEQNNEQEAFAQLDLALDAGINFIDTAECTRSRLTNKPWGTPRPSSAAG